MLYLACRPNNPWGTKFNMTSAQAIMPLLKAQPYIEDVLIWNNEPVTHKLDDFRRTKLSFSSNNLADLHCYHMKLPCHIKDKPWLTVDSPIQSDIIINRSPRYHNKKFDWAEFIRIHKHRDIAYVGIKPEYDKFSRTIKAQIRFHQTENFLELARIIAGCTLFVGNQSAPYAVAEGLKIPAWLEVYPSCPNCQFYRSEVRHLSVYPEKHEMTYIPLL